jgi:hypothetical protein
VHAPKSTLSFGLTFSLIAGLCLIALAYFSHQEMLNLSDASFVTGWILLATMISLGVFNIRKRMSALPLGRAAYWLTLHVVLGFFAVGAFLVHTNYVWPTGAYEQLLAGLFWLTAISGILGWLYQRATPRRLSRIGYEVIFERVPAEIAHLREKAEAAALGAIGSSGQPTLGRFYSESLDWFFQRPRFAVSHLLGTGAADHWLEQRILAVRRLLGSDELKALDEIEKIARLKISVDTHYAIQRSLKLWVFAHVLLTSATLSLSVWHIILVHVYAR